MNELKRLLTATNISFSEIRFETNTGIDVDPFDVVSVSEYINYYKYVAHTLVVLCMQLA